MPMFRCFPSRRAACQSGGITGLKAALGAGVGFLVLVIKEKLKIGVKKAPFLS